MCFLRRMAILMFAPFLVAGAVHAHLDGRLYLLREFPDGSEPDIRDGSLNDWEAIGGPQLGRSDFGALNVFVTSNYPLEDLDARVRLAWSGEHQRIYVAVERWDDAYISGTGDTAVELFRFDGVEIMLDGDHSGGWYSGFTRRESPADYDDEQARAFDNYQAQHYMAVVPPDADGRRLGILGGKDWASVPPYADAGGFVEEGAPHYSVIEAYLTPWDALDERGPGWSSRTPLRPGQVIGFQVTLPDFDLAPGDYHGYHTLGGVSNTWRLAQNFADGLLMPADAGAEATAAGNESWARIKAGFLVD